VITIEAAPYEFVCEPATTSQLVIDMQRYFLEPGGF
jgi:isochorismate hydrolase